LEFRMGGKKAAKGQTQKQKKQKTGGAKKKAVDAFLRKEWYDIRAPKAFEIQDIGKTIVNKTQGNKLATDFLVGRVYEVSQGDLAKDAQEDSYRIFRLKADYVEGRACFTNFNGMRLSTDKLRSMIKKWRTLIECYTDIKTAEGYVLRVFAVAFTKKQKNQTKKTAYAQTSQIRAIRKRMVDVIDRELNGQDLNGLITRLMSQSVGKEIERTCQAIFPLENSIIRRIKTLRTPKLDMNKLMDAHGGVSAVQAAVAASAVVVEREDAENAEAAEEAPKKGKGGKKGKRVSVDSTGAAPADE